MKKVRVRKVLDIENDGRIIVREKKVTKRRKNGNKSPKISVALEIGFSISLPMTGGAFLGMYLDRYLGTSPKITLLLLFLGLMVGVYSVYRQLND